MLQEYPDHVQKIAPRVKTVNDIQCNERWIIEYKPLLPFSRLETLPYNRLSYHDHTLSRVYELAKHSICHGQALHAKLFVLSNYPLTISASESN